MPEPEVKTVDNTVVSNDPNNPANASTASTVAADDKDQSVSTIDLSKLSDADFDKIFEDERLYKSPRFKELTQAKKERDKLAAEKADREKKDLEAAGEHQKLRELAEKERDEARTQLNNTRIDTAIERAANKAGAVDAEAVAKLINRTDIKIDEATGEIVGVESALASLQEKSKYLFGNGPTANLGSPTNPTNPNSGKRYKHSQLQDPKFYRENEADIRLAMKEGRIDQDL